MNWFLLSFSFFLSKGFIHSNRTIESSPVHCLENLEVLLIMVIIIIGWIGLDMTATRRFADAWPNTKYHSQSQHRTRSQPWKHVSRDALSEKPFFIFALWCGDNHVRGSLTNLPRKSCMDGGTWVHACMHPCRILAFLSPKFLFFFSPKTCPYYYYYYYRHIYYFTYSTY